MGCGRARGRGEFLKANPQEFQEVMDMFCDHRIACQLKFIELFISDGLMLPYVNYIFVTLTFSACLHMIPASAGVFSEKLQVIQHEVTSHSSMKVSPMAFQFHFFLKLFLFNLKVERERCSHPFTAPPPNSRE